MGILKACKHQESRTCPQKHCSLIAYLRSDRGGDEKQRGDLGVDLDVLVQPDETGGKQGAYADPDRDHDEVKGRGAHCIRSENEEDGPKGKDGEVGGHHSHGRHFGDDEDRDESVVTRGELFGHCPKKKVRAACLFLRRKRTHLLKLTHIYAYRRSFSIDLDLRN